MKLEDCRPEVQRFAVLMEQALRDNEHRGGWDGCDADWLLTRLDEEARELHACKTQAAQESAGDGHWLRDVRRQIADEAADVGNFAMMVADVCGALR